MDLQNVPEEYKDIYSRHYDTIRTRVFRGRRKYVYHFLLTENYNLSLLDEYLSVIRGEHKNGYKINAAFGFILQNRTTDELKFFHPSNNNKIWEIPQLIENTEDFTKLRDDLERDDAFEYARLQRPDTSWKVAKIICMRFDVIKL